jgi:hypothetical protein
MHFTGVALVLAVLLTQTSAATTGARFQGLARLYFEEVETVPSQLIRFLPEARSATGSRLKTKVVEGELETYIEVHDFLLPLRGKPRKLSLRQIVASPETSRITEVWWALYDEGKRTDVWHFMADPTRTENKALSNYEIESVRASGGDVVELQVRATMFRPQGAWWITGKVLSFSVQDNHLVLFRVRNAFGFFQDYDLGDSVPPIDVSIEHEAGGRFEILSCDSVPEELLRKCGFRDPLLDDDWVFNWARMESTALCVIRKAKVRASSCDFETPSFIERGGSTSK